MFRALAVAGLSAALSCPLAGQTTTVCNAVFPPGAQAIFWNGEPMVLMFAPAGDLRWSFLNPSTTVHELGLSLAAIIAIDSRPCAMADTLWLYSDDQTGFQDLANFSMFHGGVVWQTPTQGLLSNPLYPSRYLAHPVMGQRTDWWADYLHSGFSRPSCGYARTHPDLVAAVFKIHVLR